MLEKHWLQIGGFSVLPNGSMGVVWASVDPEWDILRIHHAAPFERAHIGLIASELRRRPWVPVAWSNREFMEQLKKEHRCRMLPDQSKDSPEKAEELTNIINERAETNRLRVNSGCKEWAEEYESFGRSVKGSKIPRDSHPLMAATRHIVDMLKHARPEASARPKESVKRKMAIV